MSFPRLSDDPLEQFLIEEAVMTRYFDDIRREQENEASRARAREQAEDLLKGRHG